jgi:16S rRNA G966 N2-methylase RsmD
MATSQGQWSYVPIGQVTPNPDNPRTIKDAKFRQLVQSIRDLPQMLELRPIVVNAAGVVLGGNMRLRACKEAGLKQVPVIRADHLTEAQQREFAVKDNVGFGEWNWDALANEWDSVQLDSWGLDVPDIEFPPQVGVLPVEEPPIPETIASRTVDGDLIILGNHRLYCGDSTNQQTINLALTESGKIGTVIFDPPFEQSDLIAAINIDEYNANDVLVFGDCMHDARRTARTTLPWVFAFAWDCVTRWVIPGKPLLAHKTCDWFSRNPQYDHNRVKDPRVIETKAITGTNARGAYSIEPDPRGKSLASVFRSPVTAESHGAEHSKPVLWLAMLIGNCTSGIVLDIFAGSGTTLLACEQIKRQWVGIELNPKYCDVIVARWEAMTGQNAIYKKTNLSQHKQGGNRDANPTGAFAI